MSSSEIITIELLRWEGEVVDVRENKSKPVRIGTAQGHRSASGNLVLCPESCRPGILVHHDWIRRENDHRSRYSDFVEDWSSWSRHVNRFSLLIDRSEKRPHLLVHHMPLALCSSYVRQSNWEGYHECRRRHRESVLEDRLSHRMDVRSVVGKRSSVASDQKLRWNTTRPFPPPNENSSIGGNNRIGLESDPIIVLSANHVDRVRNWRNHKWPAELNRCDRVPMSHCSDDRTCLCSCCRMDSSSRERWSTWPMRWHWPLENQWRSEDDLFGDIPQITTKSHV